MILTLQQTEEFLWQDIRLVNLFFSSVTAYFKLREIWRLATFNVRNITVLPKMSIVDRIIMYCLVHNSHYCLQKMNLKQHLFKIRSVVVFVISNQAMSYRAQ